MNHEIIVVFVGPAVPGGISSLQEKVVDHLPERFKIIRIATCTSYTGYDASYRISIRQFIVFIGALAAVLGIALFHRRAIFHVHLAHHGSTIRKGMICTLLRVLQCTYVVHAHADAAFHRWVPTPVRRILWWGIEGARFMITLTSQWKGYFSDNLQVPLGKLLVLPNPVVLPTLRCTEQPLGKGNTGRVEILFLGRLGKRKGVFDLIRAVALLPKDVLASCHLTIAGDGDQVAAKALVESLGCSTKVSIVGWVEREHVDNLLKQSDVFALPSHMEGMALALLEAMGAGLAVLTSSAGGSDDFLVPERNCLIVTPGKTDEIARALHRLIHDAALRQMLGTEARKTAEAFSIQAYIGRLSCLYDRLSDDSPPRPGDSLVSAADDYIS